jgi:predicted RNA-binding Zn ribbon-like protein
MMVMMETMETETTTSTEGRQPAPGELRLVQLLVNSAEPDIGREDIPDAAALGRWLVEHDLLGAADAGALGEADRERILTLREALRDLLGTNAGEPMDPGSATVIEDETCRASLKVCIDEDGGVALAPARGGIDGAVARVLAAIAAASISGTWRRLKACRDDTCRWAFYDSSRNASSAWCSMAVCGNRAKARRHRERKRLAE